MTKIAILVECGRNGLEVRLCRRICELLRGEMGVKFEERIVPMENKEYLLEECGTVARNLLDGGIDRVVILWDERPAWPDPAGPLCWHNDRETISSELRRARVHPNQVSLVCIEREFESWLLFDKSMLTSVLSSPYRQAKKVSPPRNPDRIPNPKGAMMTLFTKHGRRYVDSESAPRIAACLGNLAGLRKCPTFRRFAEKITGRRL